MHKLYKVTNLVNLKSYIGITKSTLKERWAEHLRDSKCPFYPLHCAIQKYGEHNFTIELLEESLDRNYISGKEDPTMDLHQSRITQHGYNVAKGGYGGDLGEIANKKRRKTMLAKSDEEIALWVAKRNVTIAGRTKHNHSGKLSQSLRMVGNKFALGLVHTEDTKSIISKANSVPKSTETRERMSRAAIENRNSDRFNSIKVSCLCCRKETNIGNFTQHIRRLDK